MNNEHLLLMEDGDGCFYYWVMNWWILSKSWRETSLISNVASVRRRNVACYLHHLLKFTHLYTPSENIKKKCTVHVNPQSIQSLKQPFD